MSDAHVLLVDDEPEFLEALSERMASRGLKVEAVSSGQEALEKVESKSFDAIVLDMVMPGMDGLETLRRLRENHPEVQVILLTGHATVKQGVEAIKLGAVDFLEKPAELESLMAKIAEAKAKKMVLVEKKAQDTIKEILTTRGW